MIGVGQDHLRLGLHQVLGGQGFNSGLRAYWHKPGRFYYAMRGGEGTSPSMGMATFALTLESKIAHCDQTKITDVS